MPPTHTDEGLRAAALIRERHPKTAVLLLSSYLEARYAEALLTDHPAGPGYLLKDRVYDAAVVGDALRRVLRRGRERNPLDALTEREHEILSLMAQGYSNDSIRNQLFISRRTVDAGLRSRVEAATPLRRLGTVDDVAAAVLYLASPASAYLTGTVLEVHGGLQAPNTQQPLPDL